MDDEIIYSWCFNSVECFDSTSSAAIIIFNEDLVRASDPSTTDEAFLCVIKAQEPKSNKIYKTELTKIRYKIK